MHRLARDLTVERWERDNRETMFRIATPYVNGSQAAINLTRLEVITLARIAEIKPDELLVTVDSPDGDE